MNDWNGLLNSSLINPKNPCHLHRRMIRHYLKMSHRCPAGKLRTKHRRIYRGFYPFLIPILISRRNLYRVPGPRVYLPEASHCKDLSLQFSQSPGPSSERTAARLGTARSVVALTETARSVAAQPGTVRSVAVRPVAVRSGTVRTAVPLPRLGRRRNCQPRFRFSCPYHSPPAVPLRPVRLQRRGSPPDLPSGQTSDQTPGRMPGRLRRRHRKYRRDLKRRSCSHRS